MTNKISTIAIPAEINTITSRRRNGITKSRTIAVVILSEKASSQHTYNLTRMGSKMILLSSLDLYSCAIIFVFVVAVVIIGDDDNGG